MMGPMHIAETQQEAVDNCRYGLERVMDYLAHVVPTAPRTSIDSCSMRDSASGNAIWTAVLSERGDRSAGNDQAPPGATREGRRATPRRTATARGRPAA